MTSVCKQLRYASRRNACCFAENFWWIGGRSIVMTGIIHQVFSLSGSILLIILAPLAATIAQMVFHVIGILSRCGAVN